MCLNRSIIRKEVFFSRTVNQVHAIADDPSSPNEPTSKNKLESDMLSSSDHTTAYISLSLLNIPQGILLPKNEQKVQGIAFEHNHNYPVNLKIKGMKGHHVIRNTHLGECLIQDTGYKIFFFWWGSFKKSSRPIQK